MSNVYDVVIVEEPTVENKEKGAEAKIVLGPVTVVAVDENSAGMVAVATKEGFVINSRMRTLVRPFLV